MAPNHAQLDLTEVLHRLLDFSVAAADAEAITEIAQALTELAAPLLGAANAAVATWTPGEEVIRVYQGATATLGTSEIRMVALDEDSPLTNAVRDQREFHVWSYQELEDRYPSIARRTSAVEVTAILTFPLVLHYEVLGSCFFRFSDAHLAAPEDLELMEQMVPLVVRAVARIRDRHEIENYARQLERSNADLESFAAVVAHDLSAPVRRIGSFLQLLEREVGGFSPKADKYAGTIKGQVQHLDALLRDTLAHAQVANHRNRQTAVELSIVAKSALHDMQEDLAAVSAVVEVDDLPIVLAVESLVRQVLQNMIDNALKYRSSERAPRVHISATPEPLESRHDRQMWRITVQDNGIGIDPSRAAEVFGMFTRLEVSNDRPGTGVGLAFVKRVVEQHGGSVGLDPSEGPGTRIWFTLPGTNLPQKL